MRLTAPGQLLSKRPSQPGQCPHHPNSGNRPRGFALFSEHCQEFLEASVSQGIDSLLDLAEWTAHLWKAYSERG